MEPAVRTSDPNDPEVELFFRFVQVDRRPIVLRDAVNTRRCIPGAY